MEIHKWLCECKKHLPRGERGSSIINALLAMSIVVVVALSLSHVFKTSGVIQNINDTRRSLENYRLAITTAIVDALKVYRTGDCKPGTFVSIFNKLPVGTHGVISYTDHPIFDSADTPAGLLEAATRCASPQIPTNTSTSMYVCFQALHDKDIPKETIDSRSFFLTQMAFVEVRIDFFSSGFNMAPMKCNANPDPTYKWFLPYGRLNISFYWRNMLGNKNVSRYFQDHRTAMMTLQ